MVCVIGNILERESNTPTLNVSKCTCNTQYPIKDRCHSQIMTNENKKRYGWHMKLLQIASRTDQRFMKGESKSVNSWLCRVLCVWVNKYYILYLGDWPIIGNGVAYQLSYLNFYPHIFQIHCFNIKCQIFAIEFHSLWWWKCGNKIICCQFTELKINNINGSAIMGTHYPIMIWCPSII